MGSKMSASVLAATRGRAFTLVEILVVVSIIGLLAGLAFPAIQGALNSAKKGKAKAEMQSIITALKAYQNEYGRMPDFPSLGGTGDGWFDQNNSKGLFLMLSGTNTAEQNTRQITFLELPSGSANGAILDPWKQGYIVKLDDNGDNRVEYYNKQYNGVALVISYGKNGKQEDPDGKPTPDDVFSFK